ncbi:PRK06770 family protein [Bacillus cereus group sp. BfR-BA-01379]|uniref:PRK06770 family protein n=1 Tax=Bacillus cereus group sp. BfR-BA-01379 TaxID=2920323 RepID=UPI001F57CD6D|nr:PRK06770 family protein [Bacillus cereus group sp. BfR-BA-01379]
MKNKVLTWLGIVAVTGVLAVAVTLGMLELADNPVDQEVSAQIDKKEVQTIVGREVDGIFVDVYVTENSTESEVITVMHHMTHQKVVAGRKSGSIPMIQKNVEKLKKIINKSGFTKKNELLAIADRWAKKDFSEIVEDHNYFSDAQEGNTCTATRAMDAVDEQHYILTTFGEEKAKELYNSGDAPHVQ